MKLLSSMIWAWEKKANVSTYHTYEREIIRFPPGPKKIAGRPEGQNFLQRIQHCCWLLFSLGKNTKNILWYLPPLKVVEFNGIQTHTEVCVDSLVLVRRFRAVHFQPVPHVGAMQLPTVRFSSTAPCQRRTADLGRSQRWGGVFSPCFFLGGEKFLSVFFLETRGKWWFWCFCFHLPIWKICDICCFKCTPPCFVGSMPSPPKCPILAG